MWKWVFKLHSLITGHFSWMLCAGKQNYVIEKSVTCPCEPTARSGYVEYWIICLLALLYWTQQVQNLLSGLYGVFSTPKLLFSIKFLYFQLAPGYPEDEAGFGWGQFIPVKVLPVV